jgi:hypothetical protein
VETLYSVVIIYIALELFEISWQKAENLMQMMLKLYEKYQRSILWFLLLHPTYYFAIWLALSTDYSIAALLMLFIKTVDIATKILLIQQIFEKRELTQEMTMLLLTPLHPLLPYVSLFVYTPMVVIALL